MSSIMDQNLANEYMAKILQPMRNFVTQYNNFSLADYLETAMGTEIGTAVRDAIPAMNSTVELR